jgi:hypothetical protein
MVAARGINKLDKPVIVRGWWASACAAMTLSADRRVVVQAAGQLGLQPRAGAPAAWLRSVALGHQRDD